MGGFDASKVQQYYLGYKEFLLTEVGCKMHLLAIKK